MDGIDRSHRDNGPEVRLTRRDASTTTVTLGIRLYEGASGIASMEFFFSSRRRHTMSLCDWSSDVCSSDLPAGAIPKDGPSAGAAMFTALASLFSNTPVRSDVAMTGEVTLRGLVLPIGGLKEKSLAAMRAGISTVLIPKLNEKDVVEIPEEAKQKLKFIPVETVDEVLANALERTSSDQPPS